MKRAACAVFLLASLSLWGTEDADVIVKRFLEAQARNWERASQYTYVEQADFFTVDKNGQAKKDRSETHEIIFVEGTTYKKLVARNERPLEPKEQAKEDKLLQRAAQERREQRRSGIFHKSVSLGSDNDLLTLFDNRALGEEELHGRKTWVIECTPKADRVPANAHEKEALSFIRKLWIDQAEYVPVKTEYTVTGQHIALMQGSTITWEFEKINDDAWLARSGVINGRLQFAKFIKPAVRTEYKNSKFQKFDVRSTITADPPK
ncbi:MAG: outer membrane lipoprotein-sorting protein [Acidobacteriota bacterium]|nr:outer membrane lipoprotein-sorting protein [Acidobacteriota bacterium]